MAPKRRRRGRGCLITVIVLIVVVVGLLLAADRVGHSIADDKVAEQLAQQAEQQDIKLGEQPTADITGFPFLTQVAAGHYDKVVVHLRDLSSRGYTLPKLDVTAYGVEADTGDLMAGHGPVTAERLTGTATIGYSYLQKTAQQKLSQATSEVDIKHLRLTNKHGRMVVHVTVGAMGQEVKLSGRTTLHLGDDGRSIRIQVADLEPEGMSLPGFLRGVVDTLAKDLSTTVRLPKMPYHLRLEKLTPADDGLHATASAKNVTLAE